MTKDELRVQRSIESITKKINRNNIRERLAIISVKNLIKPISEQLPIRQTR